MTKETISKRNPLAIGLKFRSGAGVHEKPHKAKRLKDKRSLVQELREVREHDKEPGF